MRMIEFHDDHQSDLIPYYVEYSENVFRIHGIPLRYNKRDGSFSGLSYTMPEPPKDAMEFKFVQNVNDFYKFFKQRFTLLEDNKENNYKIFRASPKEKILVTDIRFKDELIEKTKDDIKDFMKTIKNSHADDIDSKIRQKIDKNLESLTIFYIFAYLHHPKIKEALLFYSGSLPNLTTESDLIEIYTANSSFTNPRLNRLVEIEYDSLNPYCLLFLSPDEDIYTKGRLEGWYRFYDEKTQTYKIHIKNTFRTPLRRKEWQEKEAEKKKAEIKTYSNSECEKANCVNYVAGECIYGLFPDNVEVLEKPKLDQFYPESNAKGYCWEYLPKDFSDKIDKELKPYSKKLEKYIKDTLKSKEALRLVNILPIKEYLIPTDKFSEQDLTIILSLYGTTEERLVKKKEEILNRKGSLDYEEQASADFVIMESLYTELENLKIQKRGFKTAEKAYNSAKSSFDIFIKSSLEAIDETIQEIKDYNELLIKNLSKPNNQSSDYKFNIGFNELKIGDTIYFPYSKTSIERTHTFRGSYNKEKHINIGRKSGKDVWNDFRLSPLSDYGSYHYSYYKQNKLEDIPPTEIFIVSKRTESIIKINKYNIQTKEAEKDSEVQLLDTTNRSYIIRGLYFINKKEKSKKKDIEKATKITKIRSRSTKLKEEQKPEKDYGTKYQADMDSIWDALGVK